MTELSIFELRGSANQLTFSFVFIEFPAVIEDELAVEFFENILQSNPTNKEAFSADS